MSISSWVRSGLGLVILVGILGWVTSQGSGSALQDEVDVPIISPSPEHEILTREVGTWVAEGRWYPGGPDSDPVAFQGEETCRMVGDFWLVTDYRSEMFGQAVAGHSQLGFDPDRGVYYGTWIDSMAPSLLMLEGSYDDETQTLTLVGTMTDPKSGRKEPIRLQTTYVSETTKRFSMAITSPDAPGQFVDELVMTYRRKPNDDR